MNHWTPLAQPHHSGVRFFSAIRISLMQTCRCSTHLGASQDSRAGYRL
ncbi:hypothetical protein [Superficieibacter electus]